jgi:hypothetical protein
MKCSIGNCRILLDVVQRPVFKERAEEQRPGNRMFPSSGEAVGDTYSLGPRRKT